MYSMDNTNKIFLHKVLTAIADSIIKVFIPLYILKVTGRLDYSIIYLITQSTIVLATMFLFKKLLCSHGLLCIILHCIPIISTQILLSVCEINLVLIVICATLMALAQTLYSIPLNILFAKADKSINVSKFQIATNVGKIFFTLMSGILISKIPGSFVYLSILASIIYIMSVIPLIYTYNELKIHTRISREKNAPMLSIWHRLFHVTFSTFQITIETVIPLYLYIHNLSFEAVSTIIALVEIFKIASNIVGNHFVKQGKYKLCCIVSSIIFILCLSGIVIIKIPLVLYILSCVISISFPLCFVPMFHLFCDKINLNKSLNRDMIDRDVDIFAIRPVFYISYFIGFSLIPCIVLGFAGSILQFICQMNIIDEEKRLIAKELRVQKIKDQIK